MPWTQVGLSRGGDVGGDDAEDGEGYDDSAGTESSCFVTLVLLPLPRRRRP